MVVVVVVVVGGWVGVGGLLMGGLRGLILGRRDRRGGGGGGGGGGWVGWGGTQDRGSCGFDPWQERQERWGGGGRNRLKSISVSVPPLYYRRSTSKTPVILEKGACGRLYKYTRDPTESEWADNDLHALCRNPLGKRIHTQIARERSSPVGRVSSLSHRGLILGPKGVCVGWGWGGGGI